MMRDLPRFRETRLGEAPDGYFLDGARVTSISRVAGNEPPPFARPQPPDALVARVDALDASRPAIAVIEEVARVHAIVAGVERNSSHAKPVAGIAPEIEAERAALREARERSRILRKGMAALKECDHPR